MIRPTIFIFLGVGVGVRINMSLNYCINERKQCVGWVAKYFKDCLCNLKDEFSFGFGLISLVCWGVAEIPQIITNFHTKSTHGVSLLFLLTWVAGDIFNLTGCLLEPATLPTQYYTALLYTISTVVLVLQGIYYDHIRKRLKGRHTKATQKEKEEKRPLGTKSADSAVPIPRAEIKASPRRGFYYMSARSLAGSSTPPFRTFLGEAQSGPSALGLDNDSSSDDEAAPTLSSYRTPSASQPRPIPRSAGYGTFLAASVNLPFKSNALAGAMAGFHSRRLLQEKSIEHSGFGQWLGWLMAAIYMGGRIPQIWLNIKRGSVEGLNPLMFIFALVANVTYVLSIVVRTTEWESIKANMPWLLDAAVCVLLDLFIILQYIYYRFFRTRIASYGEDHFGDYVDATKANDS